jgi:hypothetical protein
LEASKDKCWLIGRGMSHNKTSAALPLARGFATLLLLDGRVADESLTGQCSPSF